MEETGTPISWEVTCYGNGGLPGSCSYSFDAAFGEMSCRCSYRKERFSPDGMRMKRVRYHLTEQKEKAQTSLYMPDGRQKHICYLIALADDCGPGAGVGWFVVAPLSMIPVRESGRSCFLTSWLKWWRDLYSGKYYLYRTGSF